MMKSDVEAVLLRRWTRRSVDRAMNAAIDNLFVFLDLLTKELHLLPEGRMLAETIAVKSLKKT